MYDELIAELRQHHCDAKEDDTQEVCEECAYDVIIADESVPSGIASVCVCGLMNRSADAIEELSKRPEIPETGIGDLSDGYHTFNGLYYQRMVLFAALVKAYKDKAWKSWKHEDGEPCFGGGWFIVGIDTPQGSYTYHYEDKYWNCFECVELPVGKHWDGHTEADVTRLLSLPQPPKEETP